LANALKAIHKKDNRFRFSSGIQVHIVFFSQISNGPYM